MRNIVSHTIYFCSLACFTPLPMEISCRMKALTQQRFDKSFVKIKKIEETQCSC